MGTFQRKYKYVKGDGNAKVKCPFCGHINVWCARWGENEHCSHRVRQYCREFPAVMREDAYTRVFVFEKPKKAMKPKMMKSKIEAIFPKDIEEPF